MTMPSTAAGTAGFNVDGSAMSDSSTMRARVYSLVERNRRRPVSSSCNTMPTAKTSERPSMGSIRICSGDMYETFPFMVPACVRVSRSPSATRAMPKSRIFTPP